MEKSVVHIDTDAWLLDNPHDLISLDKWQQTVNLLAELFNAPAGFLVQHTHDGYQITIASEQNSNPYGAGTIVEADANIFCRRIIETCEPLYVSNAPADPCWDTNAEVHEDGFVSYLGVPIFWPNGVTFGTLCVLDYEKTNYREKYFELIRHLKSIFESDLALIDMYQQAQKLAVTDPLTNINNRRGFLILADQRMKLAKRNASSLGLFYFDIDKFKAINDEFGHLIGDKVLQVVSKALSDSTRDADVICRMGGDEFIALVSHKDQVSSNKILKRFSKHLLAEQKKNDLPTFTISSGFVQVELTKGIDEVIEQADKEMLDKKHT